MARAKLYQPDQSWPVWIVLRVYEFFSSLSLAVLLITTVAFVTGYATFVEAHLGSAGAQFYIYQTFGFHLLLVLLAVNIFCAASIRFPWKKHQTGFVVTHIGLLLLLWGSFLTSKYNVNSQLLVYKGGKNHLAVDIDRGGEIRVVGLPQHAEPIVFNYDAPPFNWSDLAPAMPQRRLAGLFGRDNPSQPWQHPPVVAHDDPVKKTRVEIIDYYSRGELRMLPAMNLSFRQTALGFSMPVRLNYDRDERAGNASFGGMGKVSLWRTSDAKRFAGFTECVPERTVENDGVLTILADGELFHLPIARLKAQAAAATESAPHREPLSPGLFLEFDSFNPQLLAVVFHLVDERNTDSDTTSAAGESPKKSDKPEAAPEGAKSDSEKSDGTKPDGDNPDADKPDGEKGSDAKKSDAPKAKGAGRRTRMFRSARHPYIEPEFIPPGVVFEFYHPSVEGRIDMLEGPGGKLAYRAWQQKLGRVVASGPIKPGEEVSTWSMGGGQAAWQMKLDDYFPDDQPHSILFRPLPFQKGDRAINKFIKLRVTVPDKSAKEGLATSEFWLKQNAPEPWAKKESLYHEKLELPGVSKGATASFHVRETPVGFEMRLDDFDLRVDPGARMAANYTSMVTVIDKRSDRESKHVVTMNAPLDYPDPQGRILRFFQENYIQPQDGEPEASVFRVNYDPGRWVKALGSMFIVLGMVIMFYMKAYFFKREPKKDSSTLADNAEAESKILQMPLAEPSISRTHEKSASPTPAKPTGKPAKSRR